MVFHNMLNYLINIFFSFSHKHIETEIDWGVKAGRMRESRDGDINKWKEKEWEREREKERESKGGVGVRGVQINLKSTNF